MLLTVEAELMAGGFRKLMVPSDTISLVPGGSTGFPSTAVQLAAFSQAVLAEPFHATTLGESEIAQRPAMSARAFCSTQWLDELRAVAGDWVQGGAKRYRSRVDS